MDENGDGTVMRRDTQMSGLSTLLGAGSGTHVYRAVKVMDCNTGEVDEDAAARMLAFLGPGAKAEL